MKHLSLASARKLSCVAAGISAFMLLALTGASHALAANVVKFSPQGEVAQIRQVRVTFSESAVAFGDPKAASPFDVKCSEAGSSRWADDKNWIFDFNRDLPPGTQCSFTLKPGFKTVGGNLLSGKAAFQFSTGGPAVLRVQPYEGGSIEEEQAFILTQNGPATEASIRQHLYCEIEGVHERVPVKFVDKDARAALLKHFAPNEDGARVTIVQCQQRFPNEAAVKLVWDKGIATASGLATSKPQTFSFNTRKAFTASMSCQRENANAACTPISPVTLYFSSPISRKLAEDILIKGSKGSVKPDFQRDDKEAMVQSISFKPPFAEKTEYAIVLPSKLVDESGRSLSNAAQFPLKFSTADFPPLAKFPAAPFGIIELNADATLPVTLRNVEKSLIVRSVDGKNSPGKVSNLKVSDDAAIINWIAKLNAYHESRVTIGRESVETRSIGLLAKEAGVRKLDLPAMPDNADPSSRPFEVIGLPLKDPGFYVVELESKKLGSALLGKDAPMFVRTSALVTNMAVHIKLGRENGAVWVTTLDQAKPVAAADIRISDCWGKEVWRGTSDAKGVAMLPATLDHQAECGRYNGYDPKNPVKLNGYFVSARKTDEKGRADMAFALSSWNNGIESYRFNLPTNTDKAATVRAHTILDRSLFRAGETVAMKHVIRIENLRGFGLQKAELLPDRARIIHQGSNQEFQFPLVWRGRSAAETVFKLPAQAKLGTYEIVLDKGTIETKTELNNEESQNDGYDESRYGQGTYTTGSFRVEEFRLPLLQGRITPPKELQVAPKEIPLAVQLNYLNGGGASGLAVQVTSLLRNKALSFPAYEEFSFSSGETEEEQKIVANKLPVTLDKNGAGKTVVKNLPAIVKPQELLSEMSYADPNGEIQTISAVTPLWSSAVLVGVKAGQWVSVKKKITLSAIALDTNGKPKAGVALELTGIAKQNNSHRKRMVGGFYAYENAESSKDLGTLCSGKSDERGLLICEVSLTEPGNIEILAKAKDENAKVAQAKTSAWVTGRGEIWFDGENQDRMDVLPERKHYEAGETASFQVRMPFRYATALVAIEREGVIETMVVQLNGRDPSVQVPIKAEYGPNVFVSVLAVRGRMREVPWYSFFTWGWKEPLNWWSEFREYQDPSATVDLAKPAYKYGIAEITVGTAAHKLAVTVTTDKTTYAIRTSAKTTVQVLLPNGKPAAGAEIAIAAVDEALLELQPNGSWDLLTAMLQRRSYGVETATAQMQVIGKRHYGRKAVAAGGGGGKSSTRELFDTLLLWKPVLILDANGRAQIDVPLNDALTSFKIVAIALNGEGLFGTGSASIRATQDLQIITGLPPLVREGDVFTAMLTLRNTTTRAMQVQVAATVTGLATELPKQNIAIPAGEAREVNWNVTVPVSALPEDKQQLVWELKAQEQGGAGVKDALKFTQRVVPAVPVTVQQASLMQLDKALSMPITQPADGLPGRGGVAISLMPSLAGSQEGIRKYFNDYPYSCLEQKTSRAIGLRDAAQWQKVASDLPSYLDGDGLAYYYPPGETSANRGSDSLTAYLISATHEANYAVPDASRNKMLQGLAAFVEGKITRDFWSPKKDLEVRKLAALEALSRYGQVQERMLGSIQINPNLWPTSAVIDWLAILQNTPAISKRAAYLKEAEQILRARLNYQGTRMGFSNEQDDYWWWLMGNSDNSANRLILVTLNNPAWADDMSKLVTGSIQRQVRGHWMSTTANVWGSLAMEKFALKFETEKVAGSSKANLQMAAVSGPVQTYNWGPTGGGKLMLPWPATGSATDSIKLSHEGKGKPWVTLQSLAAVTLKAPFSSGYRITKTVQAIEQKEKGKYSRGDILRVNIDVDAQTDMTWVVLNDPIPAGASLLGSGLGRDSAIAANATGAVSSEPDYSAAWMAYEERSFESYRAYYQFVPKGKFSISYTMRLNNVGEFKLPQTRVEAMYAPEMFGESPNAGMSVK
ncbi:MG2 domain-containing protein [Undibacterium sp. Ren11W]|uniref:alpha-2-macroglobulin family protein n=1 Tax=Undibacterium sp. Ren11W TaxID=3413045 RepID=UPI003BF37A4F